MRQIVTFVALAGALALGSSVLAGEKDKAAEVRAWFDQAVSEYASCNVDAIGNYSAADHTGFYPDSAQLQNENTQESREAAKQFCENGGKHEMSYEIQDVVMLKDAAIILASGHYKRTEPDGAVTVDSDFNLTDVAIKTDEGWKFRHSHVGAVMPQQEVAAAGEQ